MNPSDIKPLHIEVMEAHVKAHDAGLWDYPKGRSSIKASSLARKVKDLKTFEFIHYNALRSFNVVEYYYELCKRLNIY